MGGSSRELRDAIDRYKETLERDTIKGLAPDIMRIYEQLDRLSIQMNRIERIIKIIGISIAILLVLVRFL